MCGIVGMLTLGSDAAEWRGVVERAMRQMERRGPDDAGLWSDGQCCLMGFRRLSILDLSSAGHQPMLTEDGRFALVYNGELYNFRELRHGLEQRGVRFRSTGDAEVVLQALAHGGEPALETFNGMFALAFYDVAARRLLLARDHAGIKPLYVLRDRDGFVFASQYDQILSHPWAARHAVDPAALSLYFNLGSLPPPYALLEGSFTVVPGGWITADQSGEVRSGRFFEFPRYREPDLHGAAAFEAVDAAITAAVRRQMVSDVPLGVFLSGGIDSPLVAAKMREAAGSPVPAFTLGTGGGPFDESADASRYARELGLDHVIRHITDAEVLGLLGDVVTAYSEPHDDYSIFPTAMVSRVAREQVKVVLSGDGGDDVFWGYPGRMIEPLRRMQPVDLSGWMGAAAHAARAAVRNGVRRGTRSIDDGALRPDRPTFVRGAALDALFPDRPPPPDELRLHRFTGSGIDALAQWLRWNEVSGHMVRVLQKVDRASMHASLEVRVPLLDREVIEVALRTDWRTVVDLRRGIGKLPLRDALVRHAGFQTMPKRGFTVPMSRWLRGPLRETFEDAVLSRSDFLGLPLDRMALARIAGGHANGDDRDGWLLWRLLSLALWQDRHLHPVAARA